MPFFLQNCLAIFMLISQKPVQRRGIGKKRIFSLIAGRQQYQRVNKLKLMIVFNWAPRNAAWALNFLF